MKCLERFVHSTSFFIYSSSIVEGALVSALTIINYLSLRFPEIVVGPDRHRTIHAERYPSRRLDSGALRFFFLPFVVVVLRQLLFCSHLRAEFGAGLRILKIQIR